MRFKNVPLKLKLVIFIVVGVSYYCSIHISYFKYSQHSGKSMAQVHENYTSLKI